MTDKTDAALSEGDGDDGGVVVLDRGVDADPDG
jgi:hypothetical protein